MTFLILQGLFTIWFEKCGITCWITINWHVQDDCFIYQHCYLFVICSRCLKFLFCLNSLSFTTLTFILRKTSNVNSVTVWIWSCSILRSKLHILTNAGKILPDTFSLSLDQAQRPRCMVCSVADAEDPNPRHPLQAFAVSLRFCSGRST